jgi:hypothetical protein
VYHLRVFTSVPWTASTVCTGRNLARSGPVHHRVRWVWLAGLIVTAVALGVAAASDIDTPSTWPQAYTVREDRRAGTLLLATPYYEVQHDLKQGGAVSRIGLTWGHAPNLLLRPLETFVRDEQGRVFSDLNDRSPRIRRSRHDLTEAVVVTANLLDSKGGRSGLRVRTTFEYHWGYIKIHKEFDLGSNHLRARELCALSTVVAPNLSDYGYREGVSEREGAGPFSFGSCVWGKITGGTAQTPLLKTNRMLRFMMFAEPGVEGLEWFVGSDLSQWESQLSGRRGDGHCLLQPAADGPGTAFSVSPLYCHDEPASLPQKCAFDFYLGLPLKEKNAHKPWFHASFNRNHGNWVGAEEIRQWGQEGIQTVHCHHDGDYYDDGLFWRDGSYPPYPDMDRYDKVLASCRQAGIRTATYFSNKELHPSTKEFQAQGTEWARKDLRGKIQQNVFRGTNLFGVQMCLRSGWLDFLKFSIDRVLKNHPLDGVYYDWNVALLCCNRLHEGNAAGPDGDHWDIDELLNLMEWTRRRVGPKGLIIVHNTTTPMFAMENFADHVVANEWGYGKWTEPGPRLSELPLEWSLAGARSRGVISYGQIEKDPDRRLHRLFALEALLSGVTPWPASPETFSLFPILKPMGDLATCRFADWHNQAVTVQGSRCASAVYSRPGEAYILLGNLHPKGESIRCRLYPDQLPCRLGAIHEATLIRRNTNPRASEAASESVDPRNLTGDGVEVQVPAEGAVLLHVR